METEAWVVPAGQECEGKLAREYGMMLSAIVSPADTVNIRRSPWSVGLLWLLYLVLLFDVFYALAKAKIFHRRKLSGFCGEITCGSLTHEYARTCVTEPRYYVWLLLVSTRALAPYGLSLIHI